MNYRERLQKIKNIIKANMELVSQDDMKIIKNFNSRIKHKWFDQFGLLTDEEKVRFDALREYHLVDNMDWINTVEAISVLSHFEKIEPQIYNRQLLGKKKKQHEYGQLLKFLKSFSNKHLADFGGGVGNLSFFLNNELGMKSNVFDQDATLLEIGKEKAKKLKTSNVTFTKLQVGKGEAREINFSSFDMAIGLHSCGNFGSDLLRFSVEEKIENIALFSCCYSKILNDDYRMSSYALEENLNTRALSSATLSFEKVDLNIYDFRIKIMNYKYSFYHLISKLYGINNFYPMSNSRKNIFNKSFYEFYLISLKRFCPEQEVLPEEDVNSFYQSAENRAMNDYFSCYYAFSRYLGQAIETYINLDRALFLLENGYQISLYDVFDPSISPRNTCIMASRTPE